jgi:hypothetical protein
VRESFAVMERQAWNDMGLIAGGKKLFPTERLAG